jgi:tRNA U34 5-methylaminomethyl-2-thiouridine-forming methyltransferase MnmC
VVYFDAFAPEKQPEMWDRALLQKVHDAMRCGGVLTTYCAKGAIRRLLADVGFTVTRLPGPPSGKREILRAEV